MEYYKTLNKDGNIALIGTLDKLPEDVTRITKEEYNTLHEEILINATHIVAASEEEE